MKVVILHEKIPDHANLDAEDTIVQVEAVSEILMKLGYEPDVLEFDPFRRETGEKLLDMKPYAVFNLVESVDERTDLAYLAPAMLEKLSIPFTGSGAEAVFLSTGKTMVKDLLKKSGIPTPEWLSAENAGQFSTDYSGVHVPFILKNATEHASIGMNEQSVIWDFNRLIEELKLRNGEGRQEFYAERYIEGREFNISLIADNGGPIVLAPQEICFRNYGENRIKIITYEGKWDVNSFEYRHIKRWFRFPRKDKPLLKKMGNLAKECWKVMGLSGYARVDFRVDMEGRPWVIDINTNPCVSPDSSFIYAAKQAGMGEEQVVLRILNDALSAKILTEVQ